MLPVLRDFVVAMFQPTASISARVSPVSGFARSAASVSGTGAAAMSAGEVDGMGPQIDQVVQGGIPQGDHRLKDAATARL